jgi:hypothetical protein
MPSPATPRRNPGRGSAKSTPTKSKLPDIGKPLGDHDSNSVREKVQLWHQQGGGVVTSKDINVEDDGDEEENSSARVKPQKEPAPRRVDTRLKEDNRAPSATSSDSRKRSNSTPRKRVVSDQHWRKERSPPRSPQRTKGTPAKRITVYKINEFDPPSVSSPKKQSASAKKNDKNDQTVASRFSNDGVRVRTSPVSTRKTSRATKSTKEPQTTKSLDADKRTKSQVSEPDASPLSSPSMKEHGADTLKDGDDIELKGMRRTTPPPKDDNDWAGSEANFSELSRRRRRGPAPEPRIARKVKGGIFNQVLDESRKMFAKPAPPPPATTNRGEKIAAWLSATPDPFVDEDNEVEIPAPLKMRSKADRHSPRDSSDDITVKSVSELSRAAHDHRSQRRKSEESGTKRLSSDSLKTKGSRKSPQGSSSSLLEQEPTSSSKKYKTRSSPLRSRGTSTGTNGQSLRTKQPAKEPQDVKTSKSDREFVPSDDVEVSAGEIVFPLRVRRPFPSTGIHRLSTIASEETLSSRIEQSSLGSKKKTTPKAATSDKQRFDLSLDGEERDQFDPNSLHSSASGLKRRLTKHSDLMSTLSDPNSGRKSVRSTRSIRSNRSRLEKATVADLMQELAADESKYMRELRTLVGGVIPVLLTCVLSRSNSAVAAGLFRPSADPKDDVNFTRPIVDMGVALERLKTLHKRIPLEDLDALLSWAQSAHRVYRDYLKAWRMGFQDVVVNLAPLGEDESAKAETQSLDQGMERDKNGDVVDTNGEKVDVAYLLKRPLVRLKYLSKTFKGFDFLAHSPKTEDIVSIFQGLVEHARQRSHEERARLEDESAASIDATRARDPETLGIMTGVSVNQNRRVLARDFFNLSLQHSSGQMLDCRAELLFRDNAPGSGPGGDLLICEIDDSDRWLLLPPIESSCVSARNGDLKGEIVVMIRGQSAEDQKWQELLSLTIDDEDVGFEWVQLLGLSPVPPSICKSQSFINRSMERSPKKATPSSTPKRLRLPSPSEINVPIGEQASTISRAEKSSVTQSSGPSILSSSSGAASRASLVSAVTRESDYSSNPREASPSSTSDARASLPSAKELNEKVTPAEGKASPGLKRARAKRRSRHAGELSPSSSQPRASPTPDRDVTSPTIPQKPPRYYGETKQTLQSRNSVSEDHRPSRDQTPDHLPERPDYQRVSSVPSMNMPAIKKIREGSHSTLSDASTDNTSDEDEWPETKSPSSRFDKGVAEERDTPPAPPPHRSSSPSPVKGAPILSPSANRQKRRSSSPLKHEYEPSTASDTSSESDTSTVRHYDMDYSSSDTSEEELEDDDMPTPLPPISVTNFPNRDPPASLPTLDSETLSPSNSASQGPYRSVPLQPSKSAKMIASMFCWTDTGKWESLFPDECSVVVTPGLIEAYEMTAAHSQASGPTNKADEEEAASKERPLIALELTPLVPIRRGTAIDISIRSPPTERSKIRSSNNIMFRSRNLEECETLYGFINYARINNPTYIALQNARGPYAGQPAPLSRYNSTSSDKRSSWFSFPRRKNSYRASNRAPSVGMASESSVGTMSSAFSALKRFGTSSKVFSIARSTITSQNGSREGSIYSSSLGSGSRSAGGSGLRAIAEAIKGADGIGLSNAKIRLYVRESTTRWRDMGAARLTIMPVTPKSSRPGTAGSLASPPASSPDANDATPDIATGEALDDAMDEPIPDGVSTPTPAASPRRAAVAQEKRILINGKTAGEILLDACLGESSFERVARTGIAISVWEDHQGVLHKGGVIGGSFRVYMIQMKSEAEAAYTFGLVGKLRY